MDMQLTQRHHTHLAGNHLQPMRVHRLINRQLLTANQLPKRMNTQMNRLTIATQMIQKMLMTLKLMNQVSFHGPVPHIWFE